MRIGLVAPPWVAVPPPGYGGTEVVIDHLARGLVARGHEVRLFASGDSTCPVERSSLYPAALGIWPDEAALVELRHVSAAYHALADLDVIHDHTLLGPLAGPRRGSAPVVATNHHPFDRGLDDVLSGVDERVGVIAISAAQAASAKRTRIAAVIHHGIDVAAFPVGAGGDYAVFLGRMHPDKGVDLAIDAAQLAGIPLVIAGKCTEVDERAYFADRIRPRLGPAVDFIGEVAWRDKVALLGAARCLINPIRWNEPFGMVMIESLACGTPVVASDAGAASEIVEQGRTGYLAGDVTELAAAVMASGGLDRGACRLSARLRFSTERMVAEHLSLYERIVRDGPSRLQGGGDGRP
ncbi:MAG: glycosyltransferase family 4 protein [Actinomycetota bacterium]|nr:glycosyltransferase family 4 protein [Actinomycetota bacterium]